jgi:hypothetical protein
VSERPCGLGELEDPVGGKRADGKVVIAGPAEPAQVRATPDDLDQQARAEFGVWRENARHRGIDRLGRLQRRLTDRHRRVAGDVVAGQRPVGAVIRLVERWNVEAAFVRQLPEQIRAIAGRAEGPPQRRHE